MLQQQGEKAAALYCRLSRDDEFQGDSSSIQTQKYMLSQFAKQNGFTDTVYYVDDGYSGTTFERPDFLKLIDDIEDGHIGTVITKDLSRLGRDYLKTGFYTECYFPDNHVRYIAINDNVDTASGENEFVPFKNIINEWYARDISKKIKSAYKTKALKGEFTGPYASYGYKKNPEDKHKLIIDQETAPIVRKIFELAASGITPYRITNILKRENILKPRAKMIHDYGKYVYEKYIKYHYDWGTQSIFSMLKNRVYLGHMVCNKYTSKSFKDRKLVAVPKEQWIEVKNTHEPIVDDILFEKAQRVTAVKRKPVKETGTYQMFIGLLRCSTCGMTMGFARAKEKNGKGQYGCSTYRRYGKNYCSMHYITYDNLYKVILNDIKAQAGNAKLDSDNLIKRLAELDGEKNKVCRVQAEKETQKAEKRIEELNVIIKRLYEDNVLGRISDERFMVLSKDYEAEQTEIKAKFSSFKNDILAYNSKKSNAEQFAGIIAKYSEIEELNAEILNELIDKIVIYECEYLNGERTQKIEINYNFVGSI